MLYLPAALLPGSAFGASARETNRRLLSAVENCYQQYDSRAGKAETDAAGERVVVAEDCPELEYYLENSAIAGALQPPFPGTVGEWELVLLWNILDAARSRERSHAYAFDHAGLDGLLSGIYKPEVQEQRTWSWWAAFREWLRGLFPKVGESTQLSRFAEWLDALLPSERTVKFMIYGLLAAVILGALSVLLLEARAAGLAVHAVNLFRGRARKRFVPSELRNVTEPGLDEIRNLPLSARTPALLKLCITRLARAAILDADRGFTNHELLLKLRQRYPALSPPFETLVNYAENYVYGGHAPTIEGVEDSFRSAEALMRAAATV